MEGQRVINEHLEDSVPEYYSRNPAVRWLFRRRLAAAVAFLRRTGCRSLVDLGCGDGLLVRQVLAGGLGLTDLQAVDMHPEVVRLNDTCKGCRFSCQNLEHLQFRDGQFDAATCLDVLEHFGDLAAPLAEIRRILKPGGHLVTSEPTESGIYKALRWVLKGHLSKTDESSIDFHFQNAASVEKAILAAGFSRAGRRRIPLSPPLDLFHITWFTKT